MADPEKTFPCVLDLDRDCPDNCPLRYDHETGTQRAAREATRSAEQMIKFLKGHSAKWMASFRTERSIAARRFGIIELCEHYPEADIIQNP